MSKVAGLARGVARGVAGGVSVRNHLDRYREIAETLARHGFGALVRAVGLDRRVRLPAVLNRRLQTAGTHTAAEHLRLALEELGPTFVKLGQVLSTRQDLLPPAYLAELARLQDRLPPIPAALVDELIAVELGAPPAQVFATFDPVPLAAASIGQAHAATLPDGTEVIVKVRRPDVVERIEQDLEILHNLAASADRRWGDAAGYDLPGLVEEFARTLRAELDYLAESRNAERFAANFADHPGVHIPRVHWDTTTSRVLTLERIRGLKVSDLTALEEAGIDRRSLAVRATEVAARMIFEDGFFHADPHPGNLFIEPDGRIGLIDFGMVGVVDAELRDRLALLMVALLRKDPRRVAAALVRLAVTPPEVPLSVLAADLAPVIGLYTGRSLHEVPIGRLVREVLGVLRRRRLQLPREMSLLLKMVLMTEGMGVALDPDFHLGEVLAPYAARLVAGRYSPTVLLQHLGAAGADAMELAALLPEQLRRLQNMLDAGGPEVHLRAAELEPLVSRLEELMQRVVAGVVVAAAVRGVTEVVAAERRNGSAWQGPVLSAASGAAGSLAVWLALRPRRRR